MITLVPLLIPTVRSNHPTVFSEEAISKFQVTLFLHKDPKDWEKVYDDDHLKNDLLDIFYEDFTFISERTSFENSSGWLLLTRYRKNNSLNKF